MKKNILMPPDTEAASTAISFIENRGQLADSSGAAVEEVRFYNTAAYPPTYFHHDRVSFVAAAIDTVAETPDTLHRVDMAFKNGKNDAWAYGIGRRQAYHNYYLSHIPEGRARVGLYERVVQADIYNKIDLMAYSNNAGVKYYFIIEPGGNPEDILLKFEGQSGMAATEVGGVEIETSVGKFELPPPEAYQVDAEGGRVEVEWQPEYEIEGDSIVFFGGIDEYDEEKHLVIEMKRPVNTDNIAPGIWSTYYGGSSFLDIINNFAVDASKNSLACGITRSIDFPTLNPIQGFNLFSGAGLDAFALKFNKGGESIWATFYGGGYNFSGFPFHYSDINQGDNNTAADAFILTVDGSLEQKYLSYWGGGRFETPLGFRLLGEDYIIFGGESSSASSAGPTIPLGTLSVNSYLQDDVNNGADAFISQLTLPESIGCVVNTKEEMGSQQGLLVYPNPTAGTIFIKTSIPGHQLRYSLYDGFGRRLSAGSISQTVEGLPAIGLSSYPAGVYYLYLEGPGLSQGFKILKY